MVTTSQKTKEHAFKRIQKDIKEGLGTPFMERNSFWCVGLVDAIVERYVEPNLRQINCSRLDRDAATVDAIIEQCETLPMLSEKRIVIVDGFRGDGKC